MSSTESGKNFSSTSSKVNSFFSTGNLLCSLLFSATIISQSLMDLFAAITVIYFTFYFYKFRRHVDFDFNGFRTEPAYLLLFLWFFVALVSLSISPMTFNFKAFFVFKWMLGFLLLKFFFTIALSENRLETKTFKIAFVVFSLSALYTILVWLLGFDPLNKDNDLSPWVGGVRSGGFLGNPMIFAHTNGIHIMIWTGVLYTFYQSQSRLRFIIGTALVFGLIAQALTFTRGTWLALVASVMLISVLQHRRLAMYLFGSFCVIFVTLFSVWEMFRVRVLNFHTHGDERVIIWKAHWKVFTDNPIFGAGPGNTPEIVTQIYKDWGVPASTQIGHAHNQFLHWLATLGVSGAIVAMALFGYFWVMTFRLISEMKNDHINQKYLGVLYGCLLAQTFWFFGTFTEANFESSKMKVCIMLIWAFVLSMKYHVKSTSAHPLSPT